MGVHGDCYSPAPTGIIVCIVGLSAMSFFKNMEKEQQEVSA